MGIDMLLVGVEAAVLAGRGVLAVLLLVLVMAVAGAQVIIRVKMLQLIQVLVAGVVLLDQEAIQTAEKAAQA